MTKLRKSIAAALAVATLSTAGVFAPMTSANAGGYWSPGNGYYGSPPSYGGYYKPYRPRCKWVRVPYRWDYYGRPIGWRKVQRCW